MANGFTEGKRLTYVAARVERKWWYGRECVGLASSPDEMPSPGDGPPHAILNWADANSGFIDVLEGTSNTALESITT